MSNSCNNDCKNCARNCADRKNPSDFLEIPHSLSRINKVVGIVSGKGGVGKSLVTSMLSVHFNRKGYNVAILDADITGPSIPKAFGIKEKASGDKTGLIPVRTKTGIQVMSTNLLLKNDTDPVVWRGPVISGMVRQFWKDVIWEDVDFMFIDMPPGTGDVPLTIFQSIPVDGIVIVTSPQELVSMIVAKAAKMANLMNIPILGIVENMSYFECPDCGGKHSIFGESHIEDIAKEYNIDTIDKLGINPKLASAVDKGMIELFDGAGLENIQAKIEGLIG
ncbi:MAG: Mrp/NBP35 family ATP-binding protein [Clostridiaceae bacterium]|nr:Mrp/NBP35 family ATP-binding protein [Clostridiaceae bacterium]